MSPIQTLAPHIRRAAVRRSHISAPLTLPATRAATRKRAGYDRNPPDRTTPTWLTPRPYIQALGPFDWDPCTPDAMPWRTAKRMLTENDDGLATDWPKSAFVFHNPPYGANQHAWMKKAAKHGRGISLVLCRMDTAWMHDWVLNQPSTKAVLFLRGRVRFCKPDGSPGGSCGAPAMFVAHGKEAAKRLSRAVREGALRGVLLEIDHIA